MIQKVYGLFGLSFTIRLSTRPHEFIGSISLWDQTEAILDDVIQSFTELDNVDKNIGDGAFYGPKIDITLVDRYIRSVQC